MLDGANGLVEGSFPSNASINEAWTYFGCNDLNACTYSGLKKPDGNNNNQLANFNRPPSCPEITSPGNGGQQNQEEGQSTQNLDGETQSAAAEAVADAIDQNVSMVCLIFLPILLRQ